MGFYEFASDSPYLAFFLALLLAEMLIQVARAVRDVFYSKRKQ